MIGTITFHWATNYGAVLQAFALQKWLLNQGFETEIIDYVPIYEKLKNFVFNLKEGNIAEIKKENKIKSFRKNNLKLSTRVYSLKKLREKSEKYNIVICGSDQIWNQYFTLHGSCGGSNLSYFLDFANDNTMKLAYAASFGATAVQEDYSKIVLDKLLRFDKISVREQTAVGILEKMGIRSQVVCDPTFLLKKSEYIALTCGCKATNRKVCEYVLHNHQLTRDVVAYVKKQFGENPESKKECIGVEEWLNNIYDSSIVVTNSFHGIALSLILNKPFVAVLIENSGMNDRIVTLLNEVDLLDRIVKRYNEREIFEIVNQNIEWSVVNKKLEHYREAGESFLTMFCHEKN